MKSCRTCRIRRRWWGPMPGLRRVRDRQGVAHYQRITGHVLCGKMLDVPWKVSARR